RRSVNRYTPSAVVTTVRAPPIRAGPSRVTATPGTTAALGSVTLPLTMARVCAASGAAAIPTRRDASASAFRMVMYASFARSDAGDCDSVTYRFDSAVYHMQNFVSSRETFPPPYGS